jgi:hypothetical protein
MGRDRELNAPQERTPDQLPTGEKKKMNSGAKTTLFC